MTNQLEDRLRCYGTTLDRAALTNTITTERDNEVEATAVVMPLRPPRIVDRNRRHVMPFVAAAASLLLIVAGIWAMSSRHANDDAGQASSSPIATNPLLVPPGTTPKGASIFTPAGRHTAVVVSPSGAPYTIGLMENFWGTMPADTVTRTINDRPFGLLIGDANAADMANNVYGTLDQCSMTITKGPATADPWTAEALVLLEAEQSDSGVVSVDLPAGWTIAVPSGSQVTGYDYTVSNGVAGRQTTILSTPSATAATVFALYGSPAQIQRADFDGHTAWYSTYTASNGDTNTHLTWEAAGNAYDITARDAAQEQLIAFARTLVPASIADFEATNPDAGQSTVGSTAPAPVGGCPTRALNVSTTAG